VAAAGNWTTFAKEGITRLCYQRVRNTQSGREVHSDAYSKEKKKKTEVNPNAIQWTKFNAEESS
jgi:hypothetical protein